MAQQISDLRSKLDLLYRRNPLIFSDDLLEQHLGLGPGNIRVWISPNSNGLPNMVPNKHLPEIASAFGIEEKILYLPLPEFKRHLEENPFQAYTWQHLTKKAEVTEEIQVLEDRRRGPSYGLVETPVRQFRLNDRVYIKVEVDRLRKATGFSSQCYLLALSCAGQSATCLFPLRVDSDTHASQAVLMLPIGAPRSCFTIAGPLGIQNLYLLMTPEPFEQRIYEELQRDDITCALNKIACHLMQAPPCTDPPSAKGRKARPDLGADLAKKESAASGNAPPTQPHRFALFKMEYQVN